jgi:hypothetical protein
MTHSQARHEINEILDRVRWQEGRDGLPCRDTRNNALRAVIGLCNTAGMSRVRGYALNALKSNNATA